MSAPLHDQVKAEHSSGSDDDDPSPNLNLSMESENLNPAEKAAHEADTLPMDGPAPPQPPKTAKDKGRKIMDRANAMATPMMASRHTLATDAGRTERAKHAMRCPPHGLLARLMCYVLVPLLLWAVAFSMFGPLAAPPNGTLFLLIVLVVAAMLFGKLFTLVKLPPLLGMLIMGIVLKNIPGIEFDDQWQPWSSTLRGVALVIILMRAGLGLDPTALRRLSGMVFRLAFMPCLVETLVVAVASHFLLDFPWLWGFMLGFVLAAVSPAVVVPCLLNLSERGFGVAKGIPTLVIAAASVDDVLAISGFTILMGITFKPDVDLVTIIFQGPLEALIGLIFGIAWGLLVIFLPHMSAPHVDKLRFLFLLGGCLLALFGSKQLDISGAGALAVLVMAFVSGVGWRRLGWTGESNPVSDILANLWIVFQPILFGLIGTEIKLNELDIDTVLLGVLVVVIALSVRIFVSFFSVGCGNLNLKERIFVALAWLPKATVQAAIGPAALDTAAGMAVPNPELLALGQQVLTIAVLVILITAPIGAVAIMLSGPVLLENVNSVPQRDEENAEDKND